MRGHHDSIAPACPAVRAALPGAQVAARKCPNPIRGYMAHGKAGIVNIRSVFPLARTAPDGYRRSNRDESSLRVPVTQGTALDQPGGTPMAFT